MKLNKLYSNNNNLFEPINFNDGLNIIYAKSINNNKKENLHNLGKTLLIDVIDFCLLKEIRSTHFSKTLVDNFNDEFKDFQIYLELKINDNSYITIKRGFTNHTKIQFKTSNNVNDYSKIKGIGWGDEYTLDKAKNYLDGMLNLTAISPYPYRQGVTQFLRKSNDYQHVFRLQKFKRDKDWKPYIAQLLGFTSENVKKKFNYDEKILEIKEIIKSHKLLLTNSNRGEVQSDVTSLEKEIYKKSQEVDNFQFYEIDKDIVDNKLQEIDHKISKYNTERYKLKYDLGLIDKSLDTKITFKINNIQKVFEEIQIHFNENTLKSYQQLENFHKELTQDRNKRLKEQKSKIERQCKELDDAIEILNKEREKYLTIIREIGTITKYKKQQALLVEQQAQLEKKKQQLDIFNAIEEKEKEIKNLEKDLDVIIDNLNNEVYHNIPELFIKINSVFTESIKHILQKDNAKLIVNINKDNNIEFESKYQQKKDKKTEQDKGNTYQKLMCMFFDLAIVKVYSNKNFYKFIYHDAVFESMQNREKEDFVKYIRSYCIKHNIQYILTVIEDEFAHFNDGEVIKTLTDSGADGKLFKREF